jgi:hypothetical protein
MAAEVRAQIDHIKNQCLIKIDLSFLLIAHNAQLQNDTCFIFTESLLKKSRVVLLYYSLSGSFTVRGIIVIFQH